MLWQNIDRVGFIVDVKDRPYHVDCKDTRMRPNNGRARVLGSHLPWGDPRRGWDFVSTGRSDVPWEDALRALDSIGYTGPLSIEWEDAAKDRLPGAPAALAYIRSLLWQRPEGSFDAAFGNQWPRSHNQYRTRSVREVGEMLEQATRRSHSVGCLRHA
jgi:hypothetical protein